MDPADRFVELVNRPASESHLDLMAGLIGASFEPSTDVGDVILGLDRLADGCAPSFDSIMSALFMSGQLRGNKADYGDPANSYLHRLLATGDDVSDIINVTIMAVVDAQSR